MANWFKRLIHLPAFLAAAGVLQADAQEAQTDPDLKAALDSMPLTKAAVTRISSEWRGVENHVNRAKHGNFFAQLGQVGAIIASFGILQADVDAGFHDPDLKAEVDSNPLVKARIEQISSEWRELENDFKAIR